MEHTLSTNKLRKFNNGLTVIVVLLGIYIILLPFMPFLKLWIAGLLDDSNGVRYSGLLADSSGANNTLAPPEGRRLVIPQILLDEPIVVGDDPANVNLGVWHRPLTSTPDLGGNTVLVAHRFTYSDTATFYHLDKMAVGDTFAVWWDGTEYVYEVFNVEVVGPKAIEIEENTGESMITLYTCTPVWTAENRLVVQAKLVKDSSNSEEQIQ